MRKSTLFFILLSALLCSCGQRVSAPQDFPPLIPEGRTAIVAHRGFWDCEEGGFSQNSIASLRAAQQAGFWGSEFDVHLTSDDVVVVHHDEDHDGIDIRKNPFSALAACRLPNGETIPTLDEYLAQGEQCATTVLVLEFKIQTSEEREDRLIAQSISALRAHGLLDPSRVVFISFSRHICEVIAERYPQFVNQYLNGELSPDALARRGINGFDYEHTVLRHRPGWIARARELGMSSNSWTVNREKDQRRLLDRGIDALTTNDPLLTRRLLGEKEYRPTL